MCHSSTNGPPGNEAGKGQGRLTQSLKGGAGGWSGSCYLMGMRSNRGFTLIELMVVMGLAGILAAIAVPVYIESSARNKVWTASETIGSQIRQARLKGISRNRRFQVRFNCPAAGQFRVLAVNDATINGVSRCAQTEQFDSGVFAMPAEVGFGVVPTLTVSGRGIFTSAGVIPQTITVTYGTRSRTLTVSATGQITFSAF